MHSNSSFIMQELIWKTMTMHLYDAAGKFVSDGGKSAELEVWKKVSLAASVNVPTLLPRPATVAEN